MPPTSASPSLASSALSCDLTCDLSIDRSIRFCRRYMQMHDAPGGKGGADAQVPMRAWPQASKLIEGESMRARREGSESSLR